MCAINTDKWSIVFKTFNTSYEWQKKKNNYLKNHCTIIKIFFVCPTNNSRIWFLYFQHILIIFQKTPYVSQKDAQTPFVLQPMTFYMIFYICNAILFYLVCLQPSLKDYSHKGCSSISNKICIELMIFLDKGRNTCV